MRVAVDAMGSAVGPGPIVAGVARAIRAEKSLRVTLVGDAEILEQSLADSQSQHTRLDIFPASQAILPEDHPTAGLRAKPDNSIARCWQLLAERKVEAMVSAGNRSALVAAGLRLQRFLPNVQKPGLAAVLPTLKGPAVVIDVAANLAPTPAQLYQYGAMGAVYARHILQQQTIAIALLSVSSEVANRFELTRATLALFENSPLRPQFLGTIDGQEVHLGTANVIVSDGFVGGMLLQMWHGTVDFAQRQLANATGIRAGPGGPGDPRVLGGAFLGVDGICVTCRSDADAESVEAAVLSTLQHATVGLNGEMSRELESGPLTPAGW